MFSARNTLLALPSLALVAAIAAAPARASRGVAIDQSRIEITQKLVPGDSYVLPLLGVRNPGTERSQYEMAVSESSSSAARPAPPGWFHFAPRTLTLRPGADRSVRVTLAVPGSADPGKYEALVGPRLVTSGKGATIGAAAAARVRFTVESSTWLDARWLSIRRFFSRNAPWSYLAPALLAAMLALAVARRRFRLSVQLQRRVSGVERRTP